MRGWARIHTKPKPRDSSTKINNDNQWHLKTTFALVHAIMDEETGEVKIPEHWIRVENNVLITDVTKFDPSIVKDCVIFSRPAEYTSDGTAYMAVCEDGNHEDGLIIYERTAMRTTIDSREPAIVTDLSSRTNDDDEAHDVVQHAD